MTQAPTTTGETIPPVNAMPLIYAMVLICLTGAAQETGRLLGNPRLGLFVVAPAVAACYALWRPRRLTLALVLGVIGVQALLPVHTGGGRLQDWLLHYEISRHYAGLSSPVTQTFLSSRTALYQQLLGAVLAWSPGYWTYQLGAALLQGLWLWPASLLVQRQGRSPERLLALAMAPVLLAYGLYTWPWCFAAFFLLTAVLLAEMDGVAATAGIGVGLAGALLAHPGSIGYVAGIGAWILVRHWRQAPIAAAAAAAILVTQVPWMLAATGGRGLLGLLASTDPIRQRVEPAVYVVTRILVAAHSVVPFTPLAPQAPAADIVLVFFIASLPGALAMTWVAAGRISRPNGAAGWAIVGGFLIGWAIDPPQQAVSGMLDVLFLGILLLVVTAVAEVPTIALKRLATIQAATGMVFLAALAFVAFTAGPKDLNVQYKQTYGAVFLVDRFGFLPGVLILGFAALLAARSARSAPQQASRREPKLGHP